MIRDRSLQPQLQTVLQSRGRHRHCGLLPKPSRSFQEAVRHVEHVEDLFQPELILVDADCGLISFFFFSFFFVLFSFFNVP